MKLCSNGNPEGILYPDACHSFVHDNRKQAEDEGYMKKMDGVYRKKVSNSSKWRLKKQIVDKEW